MWCEGIGFWKVAGAQPGQHVLVNGAADSVVFDCIGNHSLAAYRRVLTRNGVYVGAGAPPSRWMLRIVGRMIAILALIAAGKIMPVVDRGHSLAEVARAMRYQQARHARGKVVIGLGGTSAGGTK